MLVHIPKTAGTTLQAIVERHFPGDYELFKVYEKWELFAPYLESLHRSIRFLAVMGHYRHGIHDDPRLRPLIGDEVRYATFLREPVARVVSLFNHFTTSDEPEHVDVIARHPTIDRFLEYEQARNQQTSFVSGWTIDEVNRRPDEALRVALENLRDRFEFVGITERFDASLALFAAIQGWEALDYEVKNTSASRGVALRAHDLDAGQVAAIREANRLDEQLYRIANSRLDAALARRPRLLLSLARDRLRRAARRLREAGR